MLKISLFNHSTTGTAAACLLYHDTMLCMLRQATVLKMYIILAAPVQFIDPLLGSPSELLLVTRSNDNHSSGPVMREVSP